MPIIMALSTDNLLFQNFITTFGQTKLCTDYKLCLPCLSPTVSNRPSTVSKRLLTVSNRPSTVSKCPQLSPSTMPSGISQLCSANHVAKMCQSSPPRGDSPRLSSAAYCLLLRHWHDNKFSVYPKTVNGIAPSSLRATLDPNGYSNYI